MLLYNILDLLIYNYTKRSPHAFAFRLLRLLLMSDYYLRFLKIAPKATPSEVKPVPNSGNVEAASPVFGAVCVVDTVCVCGV